ncbi:hypothetical protein ACT17Q_15860 [Cellulomonas sp. CW35]|uniref:hypothetical protein n=1 Tax=Cellulomonas sp. CW35 TaxID=3458249 RepID=UPI004034766D
MPAASMIAAAVEPVPDARIARRARRIKLVLLPVWLATFMYAGKQWQVMVNANTGEVVGERPWSVPKIVAAVLVGIVLVVLAVWFFGRNQQ